MQDFYSANEYPRNGHAGVLIPKTFREILHKELAEAKIAYEEYLIPSGLIEMEIATGSCWFIVLLFDPEGGLLAIDHELHYEDDEEEEGDEDEDDDED